jgi:hypothetical protein
MTYYIYDQEPFLKLVREKCQSDNLEINENNKNNLYKLAALGSFEIPRESPQILIDLLNKNKVSFQEALNNVISNYKDFEKIPKIKQMMIKQQIGLDLNKIGWDLTILLIAAKAREIELSFPQNDIGIVARKIYENLRNVDLRDPNRGIYV